MSSITNQIESQVTKWARYIPLPQETSKTLLKGFPVALFLAMAARPYKIGAVIGFAAAGKPRKWTYAGVGMYAAYQSVAALVEAVASDYIWTNLAISVVSAAVTYLCFCKTNLTFSTASSFEIGPE